MLCVHIQYHTLDPHSIVSLLLMEIICILGLIIVCCVFVIEGDIEFTSVYLDARCLATCSTEVIFLCNY